MKPVLILVTLTLAACGAQGDPIIPAVDSTGPGFDSTVGPVPDTQTVGAGPITFQL